LVHPQQRLLHDVLGLRHAAEHPVGDGEGRGSQLAGVRRAQAAHIGMDAVVGIYAAHIGMDAVVGIYAAHIGMDAVVGIYAATWAKPSRQLGCFGCQPSSRFALALDAPRTSVIMTAAASPASSRPTT